MVVASCAVLEAFPGDPDLLGEAKTTLLSIISVSVRSRQRSLAENIFPAGLHPSRPKGNHRVVTWVYCWSRVSDMDDDDGCSHLHLLLALSAKKNVLYAHGGSLPLPLAQAKAPFRCLPQSSTGDRRIKLW